MNLWLSHDVDRIQKTYQYLFRDIKQLKFNKLKAILYKDDPYWCFEKIMSIEDKYNVRSTFFLLQESLPFNLFSIDNWKKSLGKYRFNEPKVANIIKKLDENGWEIGLHGSYNSYKNINLLKQEKESLENVLGKKVHGIRQHYLNLEIPTTWQLQKEVGFLYDASIGYKDKIGFYEKTYQPFVDKDSGMKIIPLTLMDRYLFNLSSDLDVLWNYCLNIIDEAEENNALLSILWHQRVFYEPDFLGYIEIYERILEECIKRKANIVKLRNI